MARKPASEITAGLIMIALGLMFLGERLAFVPSLDFARLWPVILLILGVARFTAPRHAQPDPLTGRIGLGCRLRGAFWFFFVGVFFLLNNYDVLEIDQWWPLFIVAGGVWMLIGHRHTAPPPAGASGQ